MNFEASRAKALDKLNYFVENNLSEYSKLRNFDYEVNQMHLDEVNIGGQLIVGTGVFRAIKSGWRRINGSAGIEGPVVIGNQEVFPLNEATLMMSLIHI